MIRSLAEWLLTYLVHSTIALGLMTLLSRLIQGERTLERLWRAALFGPILTAAIQGMAHSSLLSLLSPLTTGGSLGLTARQVLLVPAAGSSTTASLLEVGLLLWGAIALAGIGILLAGHLRLARLVRDRAMASDGRFALARGITTPIALLSGELVLPMDGMDAFSPEELNAIIAHEQEHVRRRDPLWLLATSIVCRVLFFQPLNWIAATRLRTLAEFLCDSSAAGKTSPVAVASALASVSAWMGRERLPVTGMASPESLTLRRVRRILRGESLRPAASRGTTMLATFLAGLTLFGPVVAIGGGSPSHRYIISAYDNGGPFTVTIEQGRVLGMTMNGAVVPTAAINQDGNRVVVSPPGGSPLELTLTDGGGMQWTSRPRAPAFN
jgi:hypothetical protein